jgi:hypothetical protein
MITQEIAKKMILDSFESLYRSGTIEKQVTITGETVLLGSDAFLDSIGFVTFVADIEESLEEQTDQEIYIVLNEIAEFNVNRPELTVDVFTQYLVKLSEKTQEET